MLHTQYAQYSVTNLTYMKPHYCPSVKAQFRPNLPWDIFLKSFSGRKCCFLSSLPHLCLKHRFFYPITKACTSAHPQDLDRVQVRRSPGPWSPLPPLASTVREALGSCAADTFPNHHLSGWLKTGVKTSEVTYWFQEFKVNSSSGSLIPLFPDRGRAGSFSGRPVPRGPTQSLLQHMR